jgi:murein L,D-transpeptidase YafK
LNPNSVVRTLLASAALAAAIALGGCNTDGTSLSGRSLQPLSEKTLAEIEKKNMTKDSPILVRIFKEEAELEVWKEDRTGQFALLKSFPICRWSGDLGPKIKEGDRQAPEGFYTITPGQMNPNSQYFLAINTGFPNAYDKANGRTGDFLMIHGDCSSRGCYAMTDEQISEIYALGRESFFGGQRAFQVQAFPFKMTPVNMAKHRNNPNMPFWKMIKEGYDHFEVTRHEPKVDVCERRYVFDAVPAANSSAPLNFSPRGPCPVYQMPDDIVAAVTEKQRRDEIATAELVNRGTPVAPVKLATDGGMHPVFVAALQGGNPFKAADGGIMLMPVSPPGKIPSYVTVPPPAKTLAPVAVAAAETETSTATATATVPLPRPAPRQLGRTQTQTAFADPASPPSGNFLSNLFGLRGSAAPAEPQAAPPAPATATASAPAAAKPAPATATAAIRPKPQPAAQPAEAPTRTANAGAIRPQSKPAEQADATADAGLKPAASASLLTGAAPVVPTGSFGNNWSALR